MRSERRDADMRMDGLPFRTVLIVDDETPSRELLKMSFDWVRSGFVEVLEARNGAEALGLYRAQHPYLVITDIQMPVMDGYEFIKRVRASGFQKHTPILMLSGEESSDSRVKCYKLGAQDFLVKPFNFQELEALIHKNIFPIHFAIEW